MLYSEVTHICPFHSASSLHWILPVNNPMPKLESKCQGFNHNAVGSINSMNHLSQYKNPINNKTCIQNYHSHPTDIFHISVFQLRLLTTALIYTEQKVFCGSSKLPLSFSQCQRQFILVWQKWDKVFQQISILTVHRSEREGALQCVFTRVSGSVTKDVFHAPSSFHLNLLLLDRFFYQRVS